MAILKRVLKSLPANSQCSRRISAAVGGDDGIGVHLAVFVEPYLSAVLDGRKTIESRFAVHRCAPYQQVEPGDVILLKQSGGPVVGVALAGATSFYRLDDCVIDDLRRNYARALHAEDDDFWAARAGKRYATLIAIQEAMHIEMTPFEKRDRRGWVTMAAPRQAALAALE